MSDVKRYDLVDKHYGYFLCHKIEGEWVKWEDYARLKAEVERLTKAEDKMIEVTYIKGVAGVDRMGGKA